MEVRVKVCKAVLFDLDGTLVDAVPDLAAAADAMFAELGEAPRSVDEVGGFVGKGLGVLVERLLCAERAPQSPEALAHALEVFRRHYARENGRQAMLYPGAREVLAALAEVGVPCGVVTNKAAAFTEPLLVKLGLREYLQCVVSGDSLPQKKPQPEPLWFACERLGVAPGEALMVGDSGNDAEAARRAGMPVLLLRGGYSEGQSVDTLDCDGVISSLAELLPWLRGVSMPPFS